MKKRVTTIGPLGPCSYAATVLLCSAVFADDSPELMPDGIEMMMASTAIPAAMAGADTDGLEDTGEIDEVVVLGRFISSSQELVNERMSDAFAADLLGADSIARLGDSTVGAALRRIPGLTLVQDKFVYIRGLGERYTQTTLNGAQIPSPDLTRNVIPLDVFPTSIVQTLRVQKSYSPDVSANFGGGAVDIRTKGIPDSFSTRFEFGSGLNSENPSKVYSYNGGGDDKFGTDDGTRALSPNVLNSVFDYQGNPSVNNILTSMQRQNPSASLFDAQTENRALAMALNRNVSLTEVSTNPDFTARASVGNKFDVGASTQLGFNVGGSYQTDGRWRRARTAVFTSPDEQYGVREESTQSVNIAGTVNLGASFLGEHDISTTTLWLRNTDDETEVFDFFNENRVKSSGQGFRDYRLEFEERNMITNQVKGTHYLGAATREALPWLDHALPWLPEESHIDWFWSDSEATTDIPNRVLVSSETRTDADSGEVLSEAVRLTSSAADYRFTDLDDEVQHYGWSGTLPITMGNSYFEFSGGYDHSQKSRSYYQAQFSLGYLNVADAAVLEGSLGDVFSDANILATNTGSGGGSTYANDIVFNRQGSNSNSYLAATMTDATWGKVDWTWNETWRVAAGARWEDYRQVAVSWNPFGFSADDPQVTTDVETLQLGSFSEDRVYPAAAITYMGDLWADVFQLRLAYSQTAVRPDLREITDSSYIDPITGDLVRGNPGIAPADVDNIDLRAEWYFDNGDNLTVTLFHKDIANPIEFFEIPAADTTIAREVVNAESAKLSGIEIEGLKELDFLGGIFDTLFVQGNITLQDSELVAGPNANSPTSPKRSLSGASDYVANIMLGYDSRNARHTASLIYNVFGERLFVAGRNGAPDGFEQPFQSLDFTYFWYPSERMTIKAKAQNILGSTIEIAREDVVVFEEDPGTTLSVSFSWAL
jgi:TonB-dependent receptor